MFFLRLVTAAIAAGSTLVAAETGAGSGLAPAGSWSGRGLGHVHRHRGMPKKMRRWGSGSDSGSGSNSSSGSSYDSGSGSDGSGSSSGSGSSGSNSTSGSGLDVSKNGLAWPNGPWVSIQPFKKTMGWMYSWDSTPATGDPTAAAFVPDSIKWYPMLWGNSAERISNWKKYVLNDRNASQNSAKVAMGPNEVNQDGQADINQSQACSLMRQYILPLKDEDGWSIIGPSTNGASSGITWMQTFKSQCADVWNKIDADSLHFYGTDPQKAIEYFQKWHDTFGKPVFITETACMNYDGTATPNLGQNYAYIKAVNQFAHSTDWVKGISFYGAMQKINIDASARLATSSGSPTDLFNYWVNNS